MQLLQPVVVPSVIKQTSTIIFLHGLGDTGLSWAEILPALRPPNAKIICPNAPVQSVTINMGMQMPAWFDLRPLEMPKDEMGIKSAAEAITEVIQREVDNHEIPPSNIVLGGFSQGGALALYTGMRLPFKLGGILALSTWLPMDKLISTEGVQKPRTLQCHGTEDEMISLDRAQKSADILSKINKDFVFRTYPNLGHTIDNDQELMDIEQFLKEVLDNSNSAKREGTSKL